MNNDFPNSGSVFVNDRKRGERDPDSTGNGTFTCGQCGAVTDFRISAWRKVANRTGNKFLSLSFRVREGSQSYPSPPPLPPDDKDPF